MTAPFKVPAPARLPRDLQKLGPALTLPKLRRAADDDAEDEATLLWRHGHRSSVRLGGDSLALASVEPFAFNAGRSEEDSTLIEKPNLADPRLLRSDHPPSLVTFAAAQTDESARVREAARALLASPRSALALRASPSRRTEAASLAERAEPVEPAVAADAAQEQTVFVGFRPKATATDREEPPHAPPPPTRSRTAGPSVLWGALVGLASIAAVVTVVSYPEQSAVFVDQIVASGAALVASIR